MEELKQRVCDVVSYKKNIGVVETKIQVLAEMVAQVQSLQISGENEGKDDVQQWLAETDEILIKAKGILEGSSSMADKKRLCSTCWDPTSSWETGHILRGIDRILKERDGLDLSSLIFGLPYCKTLQSRENKLEDILEALMDIPINMIGIYGMLGVGKTVLAEELARRSQNNQLFDAIVMVQVYESLDVKLIQTQIANKIGLQLPEADDEETRAHILCNKLDKKAMESRQESDIEPIQYSKILVILDGIHRAIDLRKVGILHEREGKSRCKVVVISRNADVCKEMGAEKNFLVECLNLEEAKILFRERLRHKIESMDVTLESERYQYVENVILMKCGGLPLMINSLVCALRSMSWSNWEILVDEMERHTLLEVDEVQEIPSTILELCNNFIQTGRKQKLFLLCCVLILEGDDVPLEKLMRYGIGFGLFDFGSLDSAVGQVNSWVHELKSLSLLMESENPQRVKMHVLIQDIVISALSQGDYSLPIMLEASTGWHTRESYENSVAISMMPSSNLKCLNGLELLKLKAFVVKGGELCSSLPDNFFQGMQGRLQIVDISGMKYQIPSSIGDLKNLVTLHLENCEFGDGITSICSLAGLEVLSFRGSTFGTKLPNEIGNLTNLRVLDFTACRFHNTFPVDVVAKLNQLRELYLYCSEGKWSTDDMKRLASLPLEVFEIMIWGTSQLSPGALNFPNLRRFRILYNGDMSFDGRPLDDEAFNSYSCDLLIKNCESVQFGQSGLQDLLQRTEYLEIKKVNGLGKGLGGLNIKHFEFSQLKKLYVGMCAGMQCILDTSNPSYNISNQQTQQIFPQPCCYSFFPKLRELRLVDLSQLSPYVLPVQLAVKLRVLEVSACWSLLCIFPGAFEMINESDHRADISTVELPCMEKLELKMLPYLVALEDSSKASIIGDELQRPGRLLFDHKIKLPSLKEITISHCCKLESVFPSWIVNSLLQLEKLQVCRCDNIREVITSEVEGKQADVNTTATIILTKLQILKLECLDSLECFYRGHFELTFPKLRELDLHRLEKMKAFTLPNTQSLSAQGTPTATILFDGVIDFPSLEHLRVSWMDIELLHRHGGATIFPNLSRLTLRELANLKALPSSVNSKTLRFLYLHKIDCFRELSSIQPTDTHFMSLVMSCELEELILSEFVSPEELIDEEKSVDNRNQFVVKPLFSLRKLELRCLRQLKKIPWSMLQNLRTLNIYGLNGWNSMISTTLLVGGCVLPLLEDFTIESSSSLEAIISGELQEDWDFVRYGVTLFPCLRRIEFSWLTRLKSFSMGTYEAHFPSLETVEVYGCRCMRSFTLGPTRTPRLKHVTVDGTTIRSDRYDDLSAAWAEATRAAEAKDEEAMRVAKAETQEATKGFKAETEEKAEAHEVTGGAKADKKAGNEEKAEAEVDTQEAMRSLRPGAKGEELGALTSNRMMIHLKKFNLKL